MVARGLALSLTVAPFFFVFVAGEARADHCDPQTEWETHDGEGGCVLLTDPEPTPTPTPTPTPMPVTVEPTPLPVIVEQQPIGVTITNWEQAPTDDFTPLTDSMATDSEVLAAIASDLERTRWAMTFGFALALFAAAGMLVLSLPKIRGG